jgi:hypothetical protein
MTLDLQLAYEFAKLVVMEVCKVLHEHIFSDFWRDNENFWSASLEKSDERRLLLLELTAEER